MPLSAEDFARLQDWMARLSGIQVEPGSEALVETRLEGLARQQGLTGPTELLARLRELPESSTLHRLTLEALTNHETTFFRDVPMFEALREKILPALMVRRMRVRELNIWSAACSFGQEPYSIAMLLAEVGIPLAGWTLRVLATDLSETALTRAREGRYGQIEINRGLPARLLVKYFQQERGQWRLRKEIRERVEFHPLNLAKDFLLPRPMDLIFLRNVLIYWNLATRQAVLARVQRWLAPDGYLVLGAAETTLNLDESFERVPMEGSSWYRLRDARRGAMTIKSSCAR